MDLRFAGAKEREREERGGREKRGLVGTMKTVVSRRSASWRREHGRDGAASSRPRHVFCRTSSPSKRSSVSFLGLKKLFNFGGEQPTEEHCKVSTQSPGIFPVSETTAEIIRKVNADEYVNEEGRVEWSEDKAFVKVKDPKAEKLNNFEKTKQEKNPLAITLEQLKVWAKTPFEELDTKENAGDIEIRLKWFGLFHRRKQQYGKVSPCPPLRGANSAPLPRPLSH